MSQKIYTRQIRVPRRNKPVTAKQLRRDVQRQLERGEELVQVALTGVEGQHLLVEIGVQKRS